MASQVPSIPSWLPKSVAEWFVVPESESGDTWDHKALRALRLTVWGNRIKSVISCANQEIDKLSNDFRKREKGLRKELGQAKDSIKSYKSTIRVKDEKLISVKTKHSVETEVLERKNDRLKLDIAAMKWQISELKRKNVELTQELEAKKEKHSASFLSSFIRIVDAEQDERTVLKNKIIAMEDVLSSQKEKTAKAVSEIKDQKHRNDMVLLEMTTLKVSCKKLEKAKNSIMLEKEVLEKRNMQLEEEKNIADTNYQVTKKQLEDETKTADYLRSSLRQLTQQLNISAEFLF